MTKAQQARIVVWRLKVLNWAQGEPRGAGVRLYKESRDCSSKTRPLGGFFFDRTSHRSRRQGRLSFGWRYASVVYRVSAIAEAVSRRAVPSRPGLKDL